MATNLSLMYDGLVAYIKGKLPAYIQLADAYDPVLNDSLRLQKGFSVGIGSGVNTERQFGCPQLSLERTFNVTFTNLYSANETDASARATVEKTLMDDAFDVWKGLESITYLGAVQTNVKYVDDSGIQPLDGEYKYITVVSVITAEYFE
jgi:hypothetical protein